MGQPFPRFEFLEPLFQHVKRKTDILGQIATARVATNFQMLADQPLHKRLAQTCLLQILGLQGLKSLVTQKRGDQRGGTGAEPGTEGARCFFLDTGWSVFTIFPRRFLPKTAAYERSG